MSSWRLSVLRSSGDTTGLAEARNRGGSARGDWTREGGDWRADLARTADAANAVGSGVGGILSSAVGEAIPEAATADGGRTVGGEDSRVSA